MIGEIHFTREVVGRLIEGALSQDERQVLLEHLDGGRCVRCEEAEDPDDDTQFQMLVGHVARLQLQALRRRAEAGDPGAEAELAELRFRALMRQLNEQRGREKKQ